MWLDVLGVLFGLLVSLTKRIFKMLLQNQTSPRTQSFDCPLLERGADVVACFDTSEM